MASFEMTTTIESAYAKETATTSCPFLEAGAASPHHRGHAAPRSVHPTRPSGLGLSFTATAGARAAGRERAEQELEARRGERGEAGEEQRKEGNEADRGPGAAGFVYPPGPRR